MSRIFWDTMLFVYVLEDNPAFSERVRELFQRSLDRRDQLFTSYLALGEVMAGSGKSPETEHSVRATINEMGFVYLPFDDRAVAPFAQARSQEKIKIGDAIHLACAASAGIDLFLTGDKQLHRLIVPGIQFIADFNNPIL